MNHFNCKKHTRSEPLKWTSLPASEFRAFQKTEQCRWPFRMRSLPGCTSQTFRRSQGGSGKR